jgi:diacylglycerol kinase (ATP)
MPTLTNDLVIIQRNPTSGAGRSGRVLLELIHELRKRQFAVRMFSNPDRLDRFIDNDHVGHRIRCLVAAGGDGTVTSLFSRHPGRAIAVLPMGTENLVARYLKIPRDGHVVADVIEHGRVRRFDTALAGDNQFLLMASAGIDAEIVRRMHATRSGNIRHWTYLRPILSTIACYRFPVINVTNVSTGETFTGSHVIVSNFREYGLNLQLNPDAEPADGQLDICVFQGRSVTSSAIHTVSSLFKAQNGPLIVRFRSQHVSLSAAADLHSAGQHRAKIPVQTDGDPAGQLPIHIRINPSAMQLLVHCP